MYATAQDMINRFDGQEISQIATPQEYDTVTVALLQLTIDEGDRGAYTADEIAAADAALVKINQALTDADGQINGHISGRYKLPLATIPLAVKQAATDIARYYLYDDHAPEALVKRYDDAMKYLMNLASGKVSLGLDSDDGVAESTNAAQMTSGGNVFKREDSTDFI